jgi:hypothetical protein
MARKFGSVSGGRDDRRFAATAKARTVENGSGMKDYQSNEEFFTDLRSLIDRWCDERKLDALSRVLPGYLAFNGLTDGWQLLNDSLKATRARGHEAFSNRDWDTLNDLIHATELALSGR